MNNLIIGGRGWTYYETIGGGQGASAVGRRARRACTSACRNTLNTPIEALELEYPMRVERYELRDGSGGDGEHRGGDGVERAVRVLEPATLNLLTDRRRHAPEGARAAATGAPAGRTCSTTRSCRRRPARELAEGDVVTVRTPGGGGYGSRGLGRAGDQEVPVVLDPVAASGCGRPRAPRARPRAASSCRSPTMAPKPPAESIARLIDSSSAYSYAQAVVEGRVGDEAGLHGEVLEHAGLPQRRRVEPVRGRRRAEASEHGLHQPEVEALGPAPDLDHDGERRAWRRGRPRAAPRPCRRRRRTS